MPIPDPESGLVISYAYLWHHEHEAGHELPHSDRFDYGFLPPRLFNRVLEAFLACH